MNSTHPRIILIVAALALSLANFPTPLKASDLESTSLAGTGNATLANISARVAVGTGDSIGIAGFIIRGDSGAGAGATKRVIILGRGPSLQVNGTPISGRLMDPTLELHDINGTLISSNDNWMDASNANDIRATGLAPSDPREAAILITLASNANYTAIIAGKNNSTGIGLEEMYDLDPPSSNTGATGPTGPTGPTGATGPTGTNGTNGVNGSTGPTGPTGTAGTNGTNGATGPTGPTGTAGTNGTNGTNGATGPTGSQGVPGNTGATGITGTAGTNGTNGATGPTGTAGETGATGSQGIAGATGATGSQGNVGVTGATGATGTAGTNGTNGATGPTGTAGETGATGSQGIAGATGATGSQGNVGVTGATGATGTAGTNGTNGTNGLSTVRPVRLAPRVLWPLARPAWCSFPLVRSRWGTVWMARAMPYPRLA